MKDKVKKAIEQLERVSNSLASIGETEDYTDIAIQALEQQPCEDCISRQGVLDIINFEDEWLHDANSHNADTKIAFSGLESRVKELPSVTLREEETYEQGYADGFAECLDLNT